MSAVSPDVAANDEELFLIRNRKKMVALLINMTPPAGLILGRITQRLCAIHAVHEPTPFAVNQRAKSPMIVIAREGIAVHINR